jgi:hypothetical protein
VAIDQGVRRFATTYSDSEVIIAGDKFANSISSNLNSNGIVKNMVNIW